MSNDNSPHPMSMEVYRMSPCQAVVQDQLHNVTLFEMNYIGAKVLVLDRFSRECLLQPTGFPRSREFNRNVVQFPHTDFIGVGLLIMSE